MRIGAHEFVIGKKPYIMGILNVTPDSFSDGGSYRELDAALFHAEEMTENGADLIDVGGESTRPGYTAISPEEEIERVCPVIEAIKKRFDIPVTLDTYKVQVAEAGLSCGADMINDIWGFRNADNSGMAETVARYGAGAVLMHNRTEAAYGNLMQDIVSDLKQSLLIAEEAGVDKDRIILDPGVGFAKNVSENLSVIQHFEELTALGYPLLLGISRKSMIGLTLNLPKDEREEGTIATSVIGLMKGCSFFRVHDVKKNRRALDMAFAILHAD